jgi:glycosyltransferase involved in cell wall biosynthesis
MTALDGVRYRSMGISKSRVEILINGRFLAQPQTGVQRYAMEVLRGWDQMLESGEIDGARFHLTLLVPAACGSEIKLAHVAIERVGRFDGNLWEQVELPWFSRRGWLVNLCNIAPIFKFNQFLTIHDASVFAVPEAYSFAFRFKYQLVMKLAGRYMRKIFTDSQFSKAEIIRYAGLADDRIRVVYLGAEHLLSVPAEPGVFQKHAIGGRPYLLAVSSNSVHKNFKLIPEAMAYLAEDDFDIVIAGGNYGKIFQSTPALQSGRVKTIGYVSDGELRALYECAQGFVFPSYYEGFGIPPLEAMSCGCPVISSTAASLPEVCANAVLPVDPYRAKELAEQISRLMASSELRADLRQRGAIQYRKFTWMETARKTWFEIVDSI